MKTKVLWRDFLNHNKNIVIACETSEQATEFFKLLEGIGLKRWDRGSKLSDKNTQWNEYKADTGYRIGKRGIVFEFTPFLPNNYTVYQFDKIELVNDTEKPKITIEIDSTNKVTAYKAVEQAIAEYNNPKDWTEDEIQQARRITEDLILNLHDDGYSPVFYNSIAGECEILCSLCYGYPSTAKSYTSKPKNGDFFNKHIGRCVAICHIAGKPVPQFILDKNK